MSAIVVFGGTLEGRRIAEAFQGTGLNMYLCVATEYGASLLPDCPNIRIHAGRMDKEEMEGYFKNLEADYCLDATHPYAAEVTKNIREACKKMGLPYIRVIRREEQIEPHTEEETTKIFYKESIEEAAAFLDSTVGNIFITTGSRDLEKYTCITDYKDRCFVRVLPITQVIEKCKELGFEGKNLIGMQGPFSEELNYWMMKMAGTSWMVTKSSGKAGGYQDKCEAALRLGANIIVIGRPEEEIPENNSTNSEAMVMELPEALRFLAEHYPEETCRTMEKRQIYLIGMGPGNQRLLTKEAEECLRKCDVMIGAKRMLEICQEYGQKPFYENYHRDEILLFLREHREYRRAAILYSGDIGFYSGAKGMSELLQEYEVQRIPGIASPVYFLDKIGVCWDKVRLVSCHGQSVSLIPLIKQEGKVCTLLGERNTIGKLCRILLDFHMEKVKITVGERLSYPEERVISGYPADFLNREFDTLSLALFENPVWETGKAGPGIEDSEFLRGKVPMTKQEIRVLTLAKLKLKQDSVLYDIGAGTGSVSIEAALQCNRGHVYAVEQKPEAVELIRENKKRFQTENLHIIEGRAPECMENLPVPTHVFIGGSGGRLTEIIRLVREKNKEVRIVINAVTLETMTQIEKIKERFPEYQNMEVIQVNISKSRPLGGYHLLSAQNPVSIICFGGRKEEQNEE